MSYSDNSYRYDPKYHRLADLLGVNKDDKLDSHLARKISLLADWSKQKSKSDSPDDIYAVIESLSRKLGVQFIGKTLVDHLYQRVRVEMDTKREIESEQKQKESLRKRQEEYENIKAHGREWKAEKKKEKLDLERGQKESERKAKKSVKDYQKSIPKQKLEKIPEVDLVDHTPEYV